MSEIDEILSIQECPEDGDYDQVLKARTLEDFLREEGEEVMDGGDQTDQRISSRRRWVKIMKQRLGFKGMACCGATWGGFKPVSSTIVARVHEEEGEEFQDESTPETTSTTVLGGDIPAAAPGMNLAAALAAERHLRAAQESNGGGSGGAGEEGGVAVLRASLLTLLEEEEEEKEGGSDRVCCVCMGRNKGAAFIPCGHTFCRVCSRDLWLNRGSCPLCNRIISEILDIY